MTVQLLYRGRYQEYDTILWLRKVMQPGSTVIDVGANVGQMTMEAAHLAGPTGRVIAVEPAPGNLELLTRHVEANGFDDRVCVYPVACGERSGTEEFFFVGKSRNEIGSGHTLAGKPRSAPTTLQMSVQVQSRWFPSTIFASKKKCGRTSSRST